MRVLILIGVMLGMGACRAADDTAAKVAVHHAKPVTPAQQLEIGYPEGPWWLADTRLLMLAGSHILVSHRDAKPTQRLASVRAADRSREEAMQRAWQVYLELREAPERFAEVAARASDDPLTRAHGGLLGTLYADSFPPGFVDAFGHVAEGEVTRPVETEQGFHVLRRLTPAAPTRLGLAHLVIRYDGVSGWLRRDRAAPERTREEARALAERVAREAKQAPERFGSLVRQYSDAENALREGDLGSLSTYDVTDAAEAQLFAVAERLPPGGVSDVIELAASGFNIVRRSPPTPRPPLAASVITIGYADSPLSQLRPNANRSRAEAEQLARRLARQLQRQPEQFEALRGAHCDQALCSGVTSWAKGRHLFTMESAVERLRVGEISAEPIDSPLGLLILRREDAAVHQPPSTPVPTFSFPNLFFDEGTARRVDGS